ncbi:MAG: DUF1801 domain-containing protein [Anaerolineae bacterium]
MTAKTVDEYQDELTGWQQQALVKIRQIIREVAPETVETFKWSQPVFEHNGIYAYFKAFKHTINFGFWHGAKLDDPSGLLRGDNETMRRIVLTSLDDINPEQFTLLIRQAVALNKPKGKPTKGTLT